MSEWSWLDEWQFAYLILPLIIFFFRVIDVSLDTMRIIFTNRGRKYIAPLLGFVQVTIWLMAISQVMKHTSNPLCFLGYCCGFATGNFVGILIEEKVAAGLLAIRVIQTRESDVLVNVLRQLGHGVTVINGEGSAGPVNILFAVIKRRQLPQVVETIKEHSPAAFYSLEEVRSSSGGIMAPTVSRWPGRPFWKRGVRF